VPNGQKLKSNRQRLLKFERSLVADGLTDSLNETVVELEEMMAIVLGVRVFVEQLQVHPAKSPSALVRQLP
jgi:hypothetical protein